MRNYISIDLSYPLAATCVAPSEVADMEAKDILRGVFALAEDLERIKKDLNAERMDNTLKIGPISDALYDAILYGTEAYLQDHKETVLNPRGSESGIRILFLTAPEVQKVISYCVEKCKYHPRVLACDLGSLYVLRQTAQHLAEARAARSHDAILRA